MTYRSIKDEEAINVGTYHCRQSAKTGIPG
jgi:hypothetical protein